MALDAKEVTAFDRSPSIHSSLADPARSGDYTTRFEYAGEARWVEYVPGPAPGHFSRRLSPSAARIGVVLIGCWIFFLSGTNLALMGSVSSTPGYLRQVGLDDGSKHTELLIGTVNGVYWIGVMCGALTVGWFSDQVGRCVLVMDRVLTLCCVWATGLRDSVALPRALTGKRDH